MHLHSNVSWVPVSHWLQVWCTLPMLDYVNGHLSSSTLENKYISSWNCDFFVSCFLWENKDTAVSKYLAPMNFYCAKHIGKSQILREGVSYIQVWLKFAICTQVGLSFWSSFGGTSKRPLDHRWPSAFLPGSCNKCNGFASARDDRKENMPTPFQKKTHLKQMQLLHLFIALQKYVIS